MAECSECGLRLCPQGNGCWLQLKGVCNDCHPTQHDSDYGDILWDKLERALASDKTKIGGSKGKYTPSKRLSDILFGMKNWFKEYAPDELARFFELLEGQLSVEEEAGNLKSQSITLTHMINWVREHAKDDPEREWALLERKLTVAEEVEDLKGLSITLQHMINWVRVNAEDDPDREWVLLERKLTGEGEAENLKGQGMTLMLMINWVREYAKDDPDREWVLLERKLTVGDTWSQIITLTTMARFLLDRGLTDLGNRQVAFVVNKCLEYDEGNPIEILIAISMTLALFGVDLPATTNLLRETDDPLHRLIKLNFQDDKELSDSQELLFENGDEVARSRLYLVDALQGTHLLRTTGGIPTIVPKESLNGVVLDIPNIIGTWERELLDETEESIVLDDMIDVITERYDGEIWAHITPRTIIDERPSVELLVANPRIKLYLSSTGQHPEDYSMICIALAKRLHIVTQDKFRKEIETYPWLKEVFKEKRVYYKWLPSNKFILTFSRKSPSQLSLIPSRKSPTNGGGPNVDEKILTEEEIDKIAELQFKIDSLQLEANKHKIVRDQLNSEVTTHVNDRNNIGETKKALYLEIEQLRTERDRLNKEAKVAKENRKSANMAVRDFDGNQTENGPTLEELKELSDSAHKHLVRIADSAQEAHEGMTEVRGRTKELNKEHETAHRAFINARSEADKEHTKFKAIIGEIQTMRLRIKEIKGWK